MTDLALAQNETRRRVTAIRADQWDLATPCADWNVRELVTHLIEGSRMAVRILHEASTGESPAAPWPDDLDAVLAAELAAFQVDPDLVVRHPGAGDMPASRLLQFRITDHLIHSWDLARATGADEDLPEALVAMTWDRLHPQADVMSKIGAYGTGRSGTVPATAPLQARLLDLTGRRP